MDIKPIIHTAEAFTCVNLWGSYNHRRLLVQDLVSSLSSVFCQQLLSYLCIVETRYCIRIDVPPAVSRHSHVFCVMILIGMCSLRPGLSAPFGSRLQWYGGRHDVVPIRSYRGNHMEGKRKQHVCLT